MKYGYEKSAVHDASLRYLQWTLDQHSRIARLHLLMSGFHTFSTRFDIITDNKCQLPAGQQQTDQQ
jgi:hypothetical protein